MQEFLSRARWDADLVRDDLPAYAIEHLGDGQAVLVLDETGFLKKGVKSAGVQRQYSGTAGRIENSQIGVFLGYASRHGHTLIDRALYLPESWTEDRVRCAEACVPASVGFATKPAMGRATVTRAFAAGIPCAWVTGDCVYGGDHRLRRLIEEHGRGYVLAVRNNQCFEQKQVTRHTKRLTAKDWHRHTTLAMLAYAYLTVLRKAAAGGDLGVDLQAELLPLTVPELRRLLSRLAWDRPPDPNDVIDWSNWRRRHRQRAKKYHWKMRSPKQFRL